MKISKVNKQIDIYKNNKEEVLKNKSLDERFKKNLIAFFDGAIYELNKFKRGKYE